MSSTEREEYYKNEQEKTSSRIETLKSTNKDAREYLDRQQKELTRQREVLTLRDDLTWSLQKTEELYGILQKLEQRIQHYEKLLATPVLLNAGHLVVGVGHWKETEEMHYIDVTLYPENLKILVERGMPVTYEGDSIGEVSDIKPTDEGILLEMEITAEEFAKRVGIVPDAVSIHTENGVVDVTNIEEASVRGSGGARTTSDETNHSDHN